MSRMQGTICQIRSARTPSLAVHIPPFGCQGLERQPVYGRDDQRSAHPEVQTDRVQQREGPRQRSRQLRIAVRRPGSGATGWPECLPMRVGSQLLQAADPPAAVFLMKLALARWD
jgi:hypothetical protein